MEIKWSKQQEAVIHHRDKNMLVSAAAGSGKTAVLIERILSLLSSGSNFYSLDRFLIVTFTRAAADEMKERLCSSLDKMISADPKNHHLRRQSMLIHNAKISTIHSFCSYVIRNYFFEVGIDPNFRTADEGEEKLMKLDCAHEVVTAAFEENNTDVIDFAVSYGGGKNAERTEEIILKIYDDISAEPWPDEWTNRAKSVWNVKSLDELDKLGFFDRLYKNAVNDLESLLEKAHFCIGVAEKEGGPKSYKPAFESDIRILNGLVKAKDFDDLSEKLKDVAFKSLSGKKSKDENPDLRDKAKNLRDEIKASVKKIKEGFFFSDRKEILAEFKFCSGYINTIFYLLDEFTKKYSAKKRSLNLMDFSDLEHFALNILLKRGKDGTLCRTYAAKDIAKNFDFIMIDEYQDSNEIQELILSSVSGNEDGINNRFMVGDVKQSIYGFRHARPEIFADRYKEYRQNSNFCEVVDLFCSYRSRPEIIDTVNYLFERTMNPKTAGIDYDGTQALKAGSEIFIPCEGLDTRTEILLMDGDDPDMQDARRKTLLQTEAVLIANEIQKLTEKSYIQDKNSRELRRIEYRDCAVLVRTGKDAEDISRILQSEGVPSYAETKSGYFSTTEVSAVLNYLKILDNPLQDIPFVSVLFSPMAGFCAFDLAEIKINCKRKRFFESAIEYCETGQNPDLAARLKTFFSLYFELSKMAVYTPIHELIEEIYERTGFRDYVSVMPAGEQRAANLDMLLSKASAYEKTSYHGLFNFTRYIEELKKYQEDEGEANLFFGNCDAVKVMTIHKSKGLEFPVVFLSACSKKFNTSNSRDVVSIHKNLGIGINAADFRSGRKKSTFYKKIITDALSKEDRSEDLRVLYVALTRAEQKLYITSVEKNLAKKIKSCLRSRTYDKKTQAEMICFSASSFLDIILQTFASHKVFETFAKWAGEPSDSFNDDGDFITGRVVSADSLISAKKKTFSGIDERLSVIPRNRQGRIYDRKTHDILEKIDNFCYPYAQKKDIPIKASVTEVKRMHMDSDMEEAGLPLAEEEIFPYIPDFISESAQTSIGALRGTAYHKFWRFIDFENLPDSENKSEIFGALRSMLEYMEEKNIINAVEAETVNLSDFSDFVASDIGKRMRRAFERGELFREQPFTAGISARLLNPKWDSDEEIIVQGVIDAYFIEDGEYVLLDYKTDYAPDKDDLVLKYKFQLDVYERVLEKNTGIKVKEKMIYSTHLKNCVNIT